MRLIPVAALSMSTLAVASGIALAQQMTFDDEGWEDGRRRCGG